MQHATRILCIVACAALLLGVSGPQDLTVCVTDAASGAAVNAAAVRANINGKLFGASTDAAGECVLPLPEDEPVTNLLITVSGEGFVPIVVQWRPPAAGSTLPGRYEIPLERGTVIGGIVHDRTGTGVEGAQVTIYAQSPAASPEDGFRRYAAVTDLVATTGEDGRWRCDAVPPDASLVRLRVQLPGQTSYRNFTFTETGAHSLALLREEKSVVTVERRFSVEGVVVDGSGQPVANAGLFVWPMNASGQLFTPNARSGPDGTFEVRNCQTGVHRVVVAAPGHALLESEQELKKGMDPFQVTLEPGNRVAIRVAGMDQQPIQDAIVRADEWHGHKLLFWEAVTDEDGRAVWEGAPEDAVSFTIQAKPDEVPFKKTLTASGEEHVVTVTRGVEVSGRVADAETGEPLDEFRVAYGVDLRGDGILTWRRGEEGWGEDGRYRMQIGRDVTAYAVRVEAAGYKTAVSGRFELAQGGQTFDALLERAVSVSGIVTGPGGESVNGASVYVLSGQNGVQVRDNRLRNRASAAAVRTGEDGRFYLAEPAAEGDILLCIHDEGFRAVKLAGETQELSLRLNAYGKATGTLSTGAGPVAHAYVSLVSEPDGAAYLDIRYRSFTDAEGRFEFPEVIPGTARLGWEFVDASGAVVASTVASAEVQPGQTVHLAMPKGYPRVEGVFEAATPLQLDQPRTWFTPKAEDAGALKYYAETSADGAFSVQGLPPGRYGVSLTDGIGKRWTGTVSVPVPAGDEVSRPFVLGPVTMEPGEAAE